MDNEYPGPYVGRSSAEPEEKEPTLEQAMKNAYRDAKTKNPDGTEFRVVGIRVEGTNPISDYKIYLDDV